MSEKKHIDQFFKERLEHTEATPPEMAWSNIEARLKAKKEKRRILPFWWRLGGVAAILLLGLVLFGPGFGSDKNPDRQNNAVANQENKGKTDARNSSGPGDDIKKSIPGAGNENATAQENASEDKAAAAGKNNSPINKNTNAVAVSDKTQQKKAASAAAIKNKKKPVFSNEGQSPPGSRVSEDGIASNPNGQKENGKKENPKQNTIFEKKSTLQEEQPTPIANQGLAEKALQKNNPQDKTAVPTTTVKDPVVSVAIPDKKPEMIKKIDSTKLAVVEPNALEELLKKEKEQKIAKERKENRWHVTPNIAPIYFSSLSSDGSPLDEKLTNNEKVYHTGFSYGLSFNYALNKKLLLRSGINMLSTDYDTKGIVFYQSDTASRMQNVTPNLQGSLIQIDPLANVTQSFGRLVDEKYEGMLNQHMAYVEMPVEVTYKLLDKKFGVDVIGGISTLFLAQNDVYLRTSGFNMKIGEASNLNDIHFSTNIGFGVRYSFLKRFDARVEPLFKYQINTYSSGAGNFKPYIFGVYTGISYKF